MVALNQLEPPIRPQYHTVCHAGTDCENAEAGKDHAPLVLYVCT